MRSLPPATMHPGEIHFSNQLADVSSTPIDKFANLFCSTLAVCQKSNAIAQFLILMCHCVAP